MPPKLKVVKKKKPTLAEYLKTAKLTTEERKKMFRDLAKEHKPSASPFYADPAKEKAARKKIHTANYKKKYGEPKKIKFKVVGKTETKTQKEAKKAPPKKPKFKVVKKAKPHKEAGEKLTGLTAAQMNAMSPEDLFAKLPTELRDNVVNQAPVERERASGLFDKYYDLFTDDVKYDSAVVKYGPTGGRFKSPEVIVQETAKSIMPRRRKAPALGIKLWTKVYGRNATEEEIQKVKKHNAIVTKNAYKIMRRGLKTQSLRDDFDKAIVRQIKLRLTEKPRAGQIRRAKAMKKDKQEWYNYYTGVGDRHGNTRMGGIYDYQEGKDERADKYVNYAESLFKHFNKEYNLPF